MGSAHINSVTIISEPLDIPDVKASLSLRWEAENDDAYLDVAISEGRAVIEDLIGAWCASVQVVADAIYCDKDPITTMRGPITSIVSVQAETGTPTAEIIAPDAVMLSGIEDGTKVTITYASDPLPLNPALRGILLTVIRRIYDRQDVILTNDMLLRLRPYRRVHL